MNRRSFFGLAAGAALLVSSLRPGRIVDLVLRPKVTVLALATAFNEWRSGAPYSTAFTSGGLDHGDMRVLVSRETYLDFYDDLPAINRFSRKDIEEAHLMFFGIPLTPSDVVGNDQMLVVEGNRALASLEIPLT